MIGKYYEKGDEIKLTISLKINQVIKSIIENTNIEYIAELEYSNIMIEVNGKVVNTKEFTNPFKVNVKNNYEKDIFKPYVEDQSHIDNSYDKVCTGLIAYALKNSGKLPKA